MPIRHSPQNTVDSGQDSRRHLNWQLDFSSPAGLDVGLNNSNTMRSEKSDVTKVKSENIAERLINAWEAAGCEFGQALTHWVKWAPFLWGENTLVNLIWVNARFTWLSEDMSQSIFRTVRQKHGNFQVYQWSFLFFLLFLSCSSLLPSQFSCLPNW